MSTSFSNFSELEYEGWERVAHKYENAWSGLTRLFIPHLLQAAAVKSGSRLLDVACEADFRNIEVICSDAAEHRVRIETRRTEPFGPLLPTWSEVENREYHPWTGVRIIVDTAGRSITQSAKELIAQLESAFTNDRNGS